MRSEEAEQWKVAMEKNSLDLYQTWSLVENDGRQKVIDNRWVFKKKTNSKGEVVRYKARLVARGFGRSMELTSSGRSAR